MSFIWRGINTSGLPSSGIEERDKTWLLDEILDRPTPPVAVATHWPVVGRRLFIYIHQVVAPNGSLV